MQQDELITQVIASFQRFDEMTSYPVLVQRLASLLCASFRPRLAASVISPLRFANPSSPSDWVEDFHLHAVELLGTQEKGRAV
jgi:hypothetical protein